MGSSLLPPLPSYPPAAAPDSPDSSVLPDSSVFPSTPSPSSSLSRRTIHDEVQGTSASPQEGTRVQNEGAQATQVSALRPMLAAAIDESYRGAFGLRDGWPVFFPCSLPWEELRVLLHVPGVSRASGGLVSTWPAAPVLARHLGVECPRIPIEANLTEAELLAEIEAMPGIRRFRELFGAHNLYNFQADDALSQARHTAFINRNAPRLGKTRTTLAAHVLIGSLHTLVVTIGSGKKVWATEATRLLKTAPVMLEGRSGQTGRLYCVTCQGRGLVDGDRIEGATPAERMAARKECPACRYRGRSRGYLSIPRATGRPLIEHMREAELVLANFEILANQRETDAAGKEWDREDLPGHIKGLAQIPFFYCVIDECHSRRRVSRSLEKAGKTSRDRLAELVHSIPWAHGLTATLQYGRVRDIYGPLDLITNGAETSNGDRKPFDWSARFCDGHRGKYGWVDDGETPLAGTELRERLKIMTCQRTKEEVAPELPKKRRIVTRIEDARAAKTWSLSRADAASVSEAAIKRLLRRTYEIKKDTVLESVLEELAAGEKVIAFTMHKDTAAAFSKLVHAAMMAPQHKTAMARANAKIWCCVGSSVDARMAMAELYREHFGAALWCSTHSASEASFSLLGAYEVHHLDSDWSHSKMIQAERRSDELGITRGVTIHHWIVDGTADADMAEVVYDKLLSEDRVSEHTEAGEFASALEGAKGTSRESFAEIVARLTAHIRVEEDEDEQERSTEPGDGG